MRLIKGGSAFYTSPGELGCAPHEREEVINNVGPPDKIIFLKQSCPFFFPEASWLAVAGCFLFTAALGKLI